MSWRSAVVQHRRTSSRRSSLIDGYSVPRSAFSIYTFPDPADPTVVAVDTVTDDLVLIDETAVKRYDELYSRLRDAALSVDDSLEFLVKTARAARP